MQFSEEVKTTLWNLIDEMSLKVSEFTVHPQKRFFKKEKMGFFNADEIYYFNGKSVVEK